MPMNIIEKILSRHRTDGSGDVSPGDIVKVSVDKVIMLDIAGLHPELLRNPPKKVFDPDKVAIVFDHFVPSPSIEVADGTSKISRLASKWGLKDFYPYGRGGISHALAAEKGWLLPGRIIANTDSHTIATGAYNSIGRGLGMPELIQVLCTGETWYIVGDTNRVNLSGNLAPGVEAKDIFLHMANDIGSVPNENIEFSGGGVSNLSINERAAISTMCAELSAEFAAFPYDKKLQLYVENRAESDFSPVAPDKDAEYSKEFDIDLNTIEPMVALPDSVANNARNISEVEGIHIDQATIGSCANGRLSDLEVTARILEGKKISNDTRLIVTPSTQEIYLEADKLGYIKQIVEAGGLVTNSTCGSCFGGHMGVLGAGETGITSTTRNFKGRMGSRDAKIYMASSATVAASAIEGKIADPRKYLREVT